MSVPFCNLLLAENWDNWEGNYNEYGEGEEQYGSWEGNERGRFCCFLKMPIIVLNAGENGDYNDDSLVGDEYYNNDYHQDYLEGCKGRFTNIWHQTS